MMIRLTQTYIERQSDAVTYMLLPETAGSQWRVNQNLLQGGEILSAGHVTYM